MVLRLYGPPEPFFDKTWRQDGIELVQSLGCRRRPTCDGNH
jgi:hypothetical protein